MSEVVLEMAADEMDAGYRKSDKSGWVRFYMGEYQKEQWAKMCAFVGNDCVYKLKIEVVGNDD